MRRDKTQKHILHLTSRLKQTKMWFMKKGSYICRSWSRHITSKLVSKARSLLWNSLFVHRFSLIISYYSTELGELESRGFIAHSLFDCLAVEEDRATRGQSLNDWEALQVVSENWARPAEYLRNRGFELKRRLMGQEMVEGGMELFLVALQGKMTHLCLSVSNLHPQITDHNFSSFQYAKQLVSH